MKVKWFKSAKLSWKITILYILLFSMVLLALGGVIYFGLKYYLINQATQRVNEVSLGVREAVAGIDQPPVSIYDPEILAEAEQDTSVNIKVSDLSGTLVNNANNFPTPDIPLSSYTVNETTDVLLVRSVPLLIDGQIIGYVQTAQNMTTAYNFLDTLLKWMAISDAAGIALSFFAGWIVSKNMLKPISKIMRTASEIGSSDLSKRIEVPSSDDELSQLSITFNEMLDRIEDSFIRQGRFTADASHELRTPLTVIQGYVGILDRWGKHDENVLQESIDAIKSEANNMTYLMERLLFLARGDSHSQILEKEEFSVNELIEELEKETSFVAPERSITFRCVDPLSMTADRKLIKQMLRAIMDNSIKYTPADGRIMLTCSGEKDRLVFDLSDTGMGIPKDALEHIFERFYRVDQARDRKTGGNGLGLSIVQWIVQIHEGHIDIRSEEGAGTTVIITIPV